MHTYDEVEKLIQKYKNNGFFTGGTTEEHIKQVEKQLDVKLPEQYKWFLLNYGYGGVLGVNTEGVARNSILTVVEETNRVRKYYKLPKNFIVIENCDEYYYCLSTENGKVFYLDVPFGLKEEATESFLEYLYKRISDREENYEFQKEKQNK